MKPIPLLFIACLFAGCRQKPPVPGGGPHEVLDIELGFSSPGPVRTGDKAATVRLGDRAQLVVIVTCGIPSRYPATEKAELTVSDPAVGQLDSMGMFTAKGTGKVTLKAVVRESPEASGDLLAPGKPAGTGTVKVFQDTIEVTVVE